MNKWMVFLRNKSGAITRPFFRLIVASDINAATEIGQEVAEMNSDELLGVAPYIEPNIGLPEKVVA